MTRRRASDDRRLRTTHERDFGVKQSACEDGVYRLSDYALPRVALLGGYRPHDTLWATPTCYQRSYPNAMVTKSGSRVCTGPSASTSTFLLQDQVRMEEANRDAIGWQWLLDFVREQLGDLVPPILSAQRDHCARHLPGRDAVSKKNKAAADALMVLRAYAHNLDRLACLCPATIHGDVLIDHASAAEQWMSVHDVSDRGCCPQQQWLYRLLVGHRGHAATFASAQMGIWRSADPWSLLPAIADLPETGWDLAGLGLAGAWDRFWLGR